MAKPVRQGQPAATPTAQKAEPAHAAANSPKGAVAEASTCSDSAGCAPGGCTAPSVAAGAGTTNKAFLAVMAGAAVVAVALGFALAQ